MRPLIYLFLLTVPFIVFSCNADDRKTFSLSIEYSSPWAYTTKYTLTQSSIIVNGIDKREDRQTKDVYKRILTRKESDSLYTVLKSIPYDTLKSNYENPNFFDGVTVILKISGEELKAKKVLLYMCSTIVTDTLENLVQKQVLTNKYKWDNYHDDK